MEEEVVFLVGDFIFMCGGGGGIGFDGGFLKKNHRIEGGNSPTMGNPEKSAAF